jgi:hypothetical protein
MLRRVERDDLQSAQPATTTATAFEPIVPAIEDGLSLPPLPPDHPRWVKDAVALSARARELAARLRPIVVRIVTVWEHRWRSIAVAGRRLAVDASGSYKID